MLYTKRILLITLIFTVSILESCTKEIVTEVETIVYVEDLERINRLQIEISNLEGDITYLTNEVNILEGQVQGLEISHSDAQERIDYLEELVQLSDSWNIIESGILLEDLPGGYRLGEVNYGNGILTFFKSQSYYLDANQSVNGVDEVVTVLTTGILTTGIEINLYVHHNYSPAHLNSITIHALFPYPYGESNWDVYFDVDDYPSTIEMLVTIGGLWNQLWASGWI